MGHPLGSAIVSGRGDKLLGSTVSVAGDCRSTSYELENIARKRT
jgi:hypothetical protein